MRETFFTGVMRHRKAVIVVFLLVAAVCALCRPFVGVNYDINDYLPEGVASSTALDVMDEQFGDGIPNARVMVRDVGIEEALAYKAQLEAIDGVTEVTWLDDALDVRVPLAMQDEDVVETYYKDGSALFSVTIDEDARVEAVDAIRALVGDGGALDGAAVSEATATVNTVDEIAAITALAIVVILLVLLLTTTSWLEPVLILVGLGVAVIINGGTNLMFGEISFVTNAAGTVLQVGISLDFAVFFLHRYNECRGRGADAAADVVEALCKSSTAILTSGLTVTIGFLALAAMRFQIGPDLGFALAKGILISLVTVFTFVPALICCCSTGIERTRHRAAFRHLDGLATAVTRVMVPLACVFLLLPVPAYLASTSEDIDFWYGASHIYGEDTRTGADAQAIEDVFGASDTYVLMVPTGERALEEELSQALQELPQVTAVVSYVDVAGAQVPSEMAPASTLEQVQSDEYSRLVVSVDAEYEGADTFALVDEVRALAQRFYPDAWYLAGEGVSTTDLMETIVEDKVLVDVIAVAAVLAVLFLATRSLTLPFILVLVIETVIWLNFSLPYFTGENEFYLSYLICSTVQLGVTVDYAILFTDRYKEERRTLRKTDAVRATVKATTVPIMTSGIVLAVCGGLLGAISTHGILAQLGTFLCQGVLMSLVAVVFVLPGFLWALDWLIAKTTRHAGFCSNRPADDGAVPTEAQLVAGDLAAASAEPHGEPSGLGDGAAEGLRDEDRAPGSAASDEAGEHATDTDDDAGRPAGQGGIDG